jgi:hypothetical protein
MSAPAVLRQDIHHLPTLIDHAAAALANARDAAEVLEARDMATFAYDVAQRMARLNKAKKVHDDLIAAAHRAQADALEIEAQAKRRLADEYDAAQERGEVASGSVRTNIVPEGNDVRPATAAETGLTRKEIHEARLVRDAERTAPGIVRRTLDEKLERGEEPTKAALRKMVVKAATRGLRGGGRKKRSLNPVYEPDPAFDASAAIDGCCNRIIELHERHGAEFILSGCLDQAMLKRSINIMTRGRNTLNTILEATNEQ